MLKRFLLSLLILNLFITTSAIGSPEWENLSEKASISVLTCAPGDELYSVFGHTAIRVSDPSLEIDLAFNYGTFDFNTSFFYFKFAHGNLNYLLSVTSFKRFMREYFIGGRSVWEQELKLSHQQKNDLFRALVVNAQPENRAYQYDFFYDNCATRVGDIIIEQLDEKVLFSNAGNSKQLSFRQAIHPYLINKTWARLGIDLVLGSRADKETDSLSVMFLPDYLMEQFAGIQYYNGNELVHLVRGQNILLDFSNANDVESGGGLSSIVLMWLITLVVALLTVAEISGAIQLRILDIILFLLAGAMGLVVAYLTFISNHFVTSPNWNLIWANPFWFFMVTNVKNVLMRFLKLIQFGGLILLILFSGVLPQFFPPEFLPVWILLVFRLGSPMYLAYKKRSN